MQDSGIDDLLAIFALAGADLRMAICQSIPDDNFYRLVYVELPIGIAIENYRSQI